MTAINVLLTARNSSGNQELWLQKEDGGYFYTLCGEYEGEEIQIDFDELTRAGLEDLRAQIDLILEETA